MDHQRERERHPRAELLDAAVQVALDEGLAALTFGRVAKHVGVADRTIVYYFPTKDELIGAILLQLGTDLQVLLRKAFGDEPLAPDELARRAWPVLARRAWPVLASDAADPTLRILFELLGLAAARVEPYRSMAAALLADWARWLGPRLGVPARRREHEALALLATIDGALLLRHVIGPDAADRAATSMFGARRGPRPARRATRG